MNDTQVPHRLGDERPTSRVQGTGLGLSFSFRFGGFLGGRRPATLFLGLNLAVQYPIACLRCLRLQPEGDFFLQLGLADEVGPHLLGPIIQLPEQTAYIVQGLFALLRQVVDLGPQHLGQPNQAIVVHIRQPIDQAVDRPTLTDIAADGPCQYRFG